MTQVLPLPLLRNKSTKILLGLSTPLKSPGRVPALDVNVNAKNDKSASQKWYKLEEMLVQEAQGSLPMIFKPLKTLFTLNEANNIVPVAVVGEPIHVLIQLENKFLMHLHLKDIHLLWQYTDGKNRFASNELTGSDLESCVKTATIAAITLNPNSTQEISLSLIPTAVGEIVLKGICYCLLSSNNGNEKDVAVKGKQLFEINAKSKTGDKVEKQFKISIVPEAPCLQVSGVNVVQLFFCLPCEGFGTHFVASYLTPVYVQVTFSELYANMLKNELHKVCVEVTNAGSDALHNIYIATSKPHLLSSCEFRNNTQLNFEDDLETSQTKEKAARKQHVAHLPLPNEQLDPGQTHVFNIWLKAPDDVGPASIDLLMYYENIRDNCMPK